MFNNYHKIKDQGYLNYKTIGQRLCPYLKQKVTFNSKGFWHIIYSGRNKKRDLKTQQLRFRLLPLAVKIVSLTTTLQEFELLKKQRITYYGFIAIVDGWKIKVIVKKVGNGKPYFYSVIPNWVTNRKRDKSLFKGNMERD
jgi:hypothetical protein